MGKVVSGTKDAKRVVVERGQADPRQARCTKCHSGLAVQVPDGRGGTVYACQMCGTKFNFKQI